MNELLLGSFLSVGSDFTVALVLRDKILPGNVKMFTVWFGDGHPRADDHPMPE